MRPRILIISDSRGTDLYDNIRKTDTTKKLANIDITVAVLHGANLDNGLDRLSQQVNTNDVYDIVYVMLGVNNLSRLNSDGKVDPTYNDIATLVEMMSVKFEIFKCQIKEMSQHIVICQLIGINFFQYNKTGSNFESEQEVVDESMPILAHTINLINMEDHLISPWLTKIVHYWTNHKLYSYGKLRDGLHYTDNTKLTVAKRMYDAILKFLGN